MGELHGGCYLAVLHALRRLDVCIKRETIIAIYRTKKAINLSILRDYSCTDDDDDVDRRRLMLYSKRLACSL